MKLATYLFISLTMKLFNYSTNNSSVFLNNSTNGLGLTNKDTPDSNQIRLVFKDELGILRTQVNVEVYIQQIDSSYKLFKAIHTTDGKYTFKKLNDQNAKIIAWNAMYKTINIEILKSKSKEDIAMILHFKSATKEEKIKSIYGQVFDKSERNPKSKVTVNLSFYPLQNSNSVEPDETGKGFLFFRDPGHYHFGKSDLNRLKSFTNIIVELTFDFNLQIRLNSINDDVELDVVLDDGNKLDDKDSNP